MPNFKPGDRVRCSERGNRFFDKEGTVSFNICPDSVHPYRIVWDYPPNGDQWDDGGIWGDQHLEAAAFDKTSIQPDRDWS